MHTGTEYPAFFARFGAHFDPVIGYFFLAQANLFLFFTFFIQEGNRLIQGKFGDQFAF
jgi:hypothetical protein